MVHILNGEIVSDDDPRIKNRQSNMNKRSPATISSSFSSFPSRTAPPTTTRTRPGVIQESPFDSIGRKLGITGSVTIPSLLGFPSHEIKLIIIIVAILIALLFGYRGMIFFMIFYLLSCRQQRTEHSPVVPPAAGSTGLSRNTFAAKK